MPVRNEPVGFLLAVANRRKGLKFRALLASSGLTPRQYGVLARLWEENGLTLGDLSDRLYADTTALCRTLQAMERTGLIERTRSEQDRRLHHFFLTDHGRDLGFSLRPAVAELNEAIVQGFSESETQEFRTMLKRVIRNLEGGQTPETDAP